MNNKWMDKPWDKRSHVSRHPARRRGAMPAARRQAKAVGGDGDKAARPKRRPRCFETRAAAQEPPAWQSQNGGDARCRVRARLRHARHTVAAPAAYGDEYGSASSASGAVSELEPLHLARCCLSEDWSQVLTSSCQEFESARRNSPAKARAAPSRSSARGVWEIHISVDGEGAEAVADALRNRRFSSFTVLSSERRSRSCRLISVFSPWSLWMSLCTNSMSAWLSSALRFWAAVERAVVTIGERCVCLVPASWCTSR